MTCDRCGQRVNEVPKCEHGRLFLGLLPPFTGDADVRCAGCGHNFGPVRELIEKAGLWNLYGSSAGAAELIATLTRERDEIREYASISDRQFSDMKFLFEQAKRDLEDERKTTRARIAELEKERNEARKERDKAICDAGIAKSHADYLERASEVFGVRSFVVHANGTWEWRNG